MIAVLTLVVILLAVPVTVFQSFQEQNLVQLANAPCGTEGSNGEMYNFPDQPPEGSNGRMYEFPDEKTSQRKTTVQLPGGDKKIKEPDTSYDTVEQTRANRGSRTEPAPPSDEQYNTSPDQTYNQPDQSVDSQNPQDSISRQNSRVNFPKNFPFNNDRGTTTPRDSFIKFPKGFPFINNNNNQTQETQIERRVVSSPQGPIQRINVPNRSPRTQIPGLQNQRTPQRPNAPRVNTQNNRQNTPRRNTSNGNDIRRQVKDRLSGRIQSTDCGDQSAPDRLNGQPFPPQQDTSQQQPVPMKDTQTNQKEPLKVHYDSAPEEQSPPQDDGSYDTVEDTRAQRSAQQQQPPPPQEGLDKSSGYKQPAEDGGLDKTSGYQKNPSPEQMRDLDQELGGGTVSVTILNYNNIIDCYSDAATARLCNDTKKKQADLNKDGKVNYLDYNIFISRLRQQTQL